MRAGSEACSLDFRRIYAIEHTRLEMEGGVMSDAQHAAAGLHMD